MIESKQSNIYQNPFPCCMKIKFKKKHWKSNTFKLKEVIIVEWQSKLLVDGETFGGKINNKNKNKIPKKELMMKSKILSTDLINKCKCSDNSSIQQY